MKRLLSWLRRGSEKEHRTQLVSLVHKTLELDRKRVELDHLNRLAEGALRDLRRPPRV